MQQTIKISIVILRGHGSKFKKYEINYPQKWQKRRQNSIVYCRGLTYQAQFFETKRWRGWRDRAGGG